MGEGDFSMGRGKRMLVIDDAGFIRAQLRSLFEPQGFEVLELSNVEDFFSTYWMYKDVDVVLLDVQLSGMDGVAALRAMKQESCKRWPPVIMLSGCTDRGVIQTSLLLGAKDYIAKPLQEDVVLRKVEFVISQTQCLRFQQGYDALLSRFEQAVNAYHNSGCRQLEWPRTNELVAECIRLYKEDDTLCLFRKGAEPSAYRLTHAVNVAILSGLIGQWLKVAEEQMPDLILAGLLHDIGKSQIPMSILNKDGPLTAEEFSLVQTHAQVGAELVQDQGVSGEVVSGIRQHHERLDGSGYPEGLKAQEICLTARIIAVADVFDAMTSNTVYHQAEFLIAALEQMHQEMFGRLDPHVCAIFLQNVKERLVGQVISMPDGSEAEVTKIGGGGFAQPVVRILQVEE